MAKTFGVFGEEVDAVEPIVETPVTEPVAEVNDAVTPPVVTEPVVETPTEAVVEETPIDTTPTAVEVKEVIKEVEKIVEKYPDMDEYTQQIFDALINKDEKTIYEYLAEKNRDYQTMSDFDVVKINLQKSNPKWSGADIDLEMRSKYGKQLEKIDINDIDKEENPDEYKDALKHNELVEQNEILLRRDARDARISLDEAKKNISLPKIEKAAEQVQIGPTAEEIEQRRIEFAQRVDAEVPTLTQFDFKIGDKDGAYKITDEEKKEVMDLLKSDSNSVANELGWFDKDGKQNVAKIAGDVLKLKKFEKIIASAVSQAKTETKKEVTADIKNIDLNNVRNDSVATQPLELADLLWANL